jgi:large subunit ribosomal protein L21
MSIAIVETGGKQYIISEGDVLSVEKIPGVKVGEKITLEKVLFFDDGKTSKFGDPFIKGFAVDATLEAEGRGKKIRVVKFKSKSRYTRTDGHRQTFNKIKVEKVG